VPADHGDLNRLEDVAVAITCPFQAGAIHSAQPDGFSRAIDHLVTQDFELARHGGEVVCPETSRGDAEEQAPSGASQNRPGLASSKD